MDYKNAFVNRTSQSCNTKRIGTTGLHQLFTMQQTKLGLCCFDDKRSWISNNISLPYGHKDLPFISSENLSIVIDDANIISSDNDDDGDVITYEESDSSDNNCCEEPAIKRNKKHVLL